MKLLTAKRLPPAPKQPRGYVAFLCLAVFELAIASTDYLLPPSVPISYLYYVPIVLGASWFGIPGALGCAISSSLLFHITTKVTSYPYHEADLIRLFSFLVVGGMVAEIDRRRRHVEELNLRLQESQALRQSLTRHLVHDLRTPLINLVVSLKIMRRRGIEVKDKMDNNLVEIAIHAGEWLEGMVNDLLLVQQMEQRELKLNPEIVPARELIQKAFAFIQYIADEKKINLQQVVDESTLVWCEPSLIARVLINLVGNALRFTPKEGTITVSVAVEVSPPQVVFSVQDTGPGVPPESAEAIFDEFVQVELRESGARAGTGLGLTFCKRAIEAHGGRIWVDKTVDKGARFVFTLLAKKIQDHQSLKSSSDPDPGV